MRVYFSFLLVAVLLAACAGTDSTSSDDKAPDAPDLIPHLGDVGTIEVDSLAQYYGVEELPANHGAWDSPFTDDNNGIDALPSGDGIQLRWRAIYDLDDFDYAEIYRWTTGSEPEFVHRVGATTATQSWEDNSYELTPGVAYYYNMIIYDPAGNFSTSNTVHYTLLRKATTISPANGEVFDNDNDLTFSFNTMGELRDCRVLLFDQSTEDLIWYADWSQTEEQPVIGEIAYSGPPLFNRSLYWRVDGFGADFDSGSESEHVFFSIR